MRTTTLTVIAIVLCLAAFGCLGQKTQKAAAPAVAPAAPAPAPAAPAAPAVAPAAPAAVPAPAAAEPAAAEEGVGGSSFHKNDITYSTEVVTPHVAWAEKLPGGPIKGFFIPSVEFGRDMVELMQRMPIEPTTVSIDRNWDTNCWGIGDYYGHQFRGNIDDFREVYNYVERDLTGPAKFDVIVIPGLNGWSRMTKPARDAILKRVEEGAGLVLIHPFVGDVKGHPFRSDPLKMEGNEATNAEDDVPLQWETEVDTRIWDVSPLINCPDDMVSDRGYPAINQAALSNGTWEIARQHFITTAMPMDLLPEGNIGGRFYKYQAAKDSEVLIRSGEYPILAVKNYGKGRVAAFAYLEEGFIPSVKDRTEDKIYWNYWEYYYSLLAKSIVWAAGRDGEVAINSLGVTPGPMPVLVISLTPKAARTLDIQVTGNSEFGPALQRSTMKLKLAAGEKGNISSAPFPGEKLPGGKCIYNAIIKDAASGETLNWGTFTFDVPKKATLLDINPSSDVYRRGETISAVTHAVGNLDGVSLRFTVSDDLDRVVSTQSKTTRGEKFFFCPLDNFLGKYAFITAELVDSDGVVIDQLKYKPILVVQDTRRPKEYVANVSFGGGRHFFTSVRMNQIHGAGADTGFTWGGTVDNDLNIPRGAFGVYWYDRGPTTPETMEKAIAEYEKTGDFDSLQYLTKKELFKRTGDKKFLTRVPSFNDPEYMKRLFDVTYGAARAKAIYNFDYYFVGDEGSLTSYGDAFDYDWSPYTLAAFREWLKTEYGSLEALNKEWKSTFANWDDVIPLTTDEAKKSGNFAPWADHRTFMEITFANAYKTVRDGVVKGDPDGHIAVSGTQGTGAWNGCDWYRLDQVIDDFLAYGGGNQWDLHRSFAKPGAMIGFWTGYGSRGISVQNAIWTAAVHNVLYPNIFWMYAYLNPDFTLSASARDMGEAFKALKFEGVGKLFIESKRQQDGIAVHWSIASLHAAAITASDDPAAPKIVRNLQGARDGWVTCVKDLGLQFDFVSYDQLEKGKLDSGEYKVFIMPASIAISPAEAAAITKFVQDGGVVIADAGVGVMDDHCSWVENGLLNDLFGISTAPSDKRTIIGDLPSRGRRRAPEGEQQPARKPGIVGDITVTDEGAKWGLKADTLAGIEGVEAGVTAVDAKPLIKIGDTGAIFVRQVGKGYAVYLNSLLDVYSSLRRNSFGGDNYRALVKALLAGAGVKPEVELLDVDGKPLGQVVLARYRFGDGEALAIVKENVSLRAVTGMDGVTTYNDARLGEVAKQDITIKLSKACFVNDIRTGTPLGTTDTVKTSITVGGALVLGLSPAQGSIALSGPADAKLGDHPSFTITPAAAGRHLVRCHFYAPDGTFLHNYATNVVFDGPSGAVVLPSAVNDAPGQYTLKATDVMTGASAEAKITLQ
jgi:hypothetical protein